MLDDDFKKIEDFLKEKSNDPLDSKTNHQLETFQKFETLTNDYIDTIFNKNISISDDEDFQEKLSVLTITLQRSYDAYSKNQPEVIKDFAISIILIKKTLMLFNNYYSNDATLNFAENIYKELLSKLVASIKEEVTVIKNFFDAFAEYIEDIDKLQKK